MTKKGLTLKQILEAVKHAQKAQINGDIVLPVVFPNALGITRDDFKRKRKKRNG